jgi:linoleate 10R-lipoxygenase
LKLDYTPKNLTNWGYNEVQYDLSINQGCVFYKLMLRAFPNHFEPDSIYAHYPMTIPSENAVIMKDLGRYHEYSWDKPALIPPRINLTTYMGAKYVLERSDDFHVMWTKGFEHAMGKSSLRFMLAGDTSQHKKQREVMSKSLYRENWHQAVKDFYEYQTLKLLKEKSCKIAGINQVDITRE